MLDRGQLVYPERGVQQMRLTEVELAQSEGRTLILHFLGNPCAGVLGRVDIDESQNEVSVGLWTGYRPDFNSEENGQRYACTMEGRFYKTKLTLRSIIGSRQLVDKFDGQRIEVRSE